MAELEFVIVKYDYKAQESSEISVKKNDRLALLDDKTPWWKVMNDQHQTGYVPSNFVRREKLMDTLRRKMNPLMRRENSGGSVMTQPDRVNGAASSSGSFHSHTPSFATKTSKSPSTASDPPPTSQRGVTNGPSKSLDQSPQVATESTSAVVKYAYQAVRADELSLAKNARVTVTEKSDDGWWKGHLEGGASGWFPSNYVIEQTSRNQGFYQGDGPRKLPNSRSGGPGAGIPETVNGTNGAPTQQSRDTPGSSLADILEDGDLPDFVVAMYAFDAQDTEELSFAKGERLEVIEHPDFDPEWLKVRNLKGGQGLVPLNYVRSASDEEDNPSPRSKGERNSHSEFSNSRDPRNLSPSNGFSNNSSSHNNSAGRFSPNNASNGSHAVSDIARKFQSSPNSDGNSGYNPSKRLPMSPKSDLRSSSVRASELTGVSQKSSNNIAVAGGSGVRLPFMVNGPSEPSGSANISSQLSPKTKDNFNLQCSMIDNVGGNRGDISSPRVIRDRLRGTQLGHKPWYYGMLSRDESDGLLNKFGRPGDFLVRDSESNPGDFSISLKAAVRNKHFWVRVEGGGYGIGSRHFDSWESLIEHYTSSPIYTNDKGDKLFLIRPLPS